MNPDSQFMVCNIEYELRNATDYSLPVPRTEFFQKQPIDVSSLHTADRDHSQSEGKMEFGLPTRAVSTNRLANGSQGERTLP